MSTTGRLFLNMAKISSLSTALLLLPGLSLANSSAGLLSNDTNNIQLADNGWHHGHHGGHHGHHGGNGGGYWGPWIIYGPGVFFNTHNCVKRCHWHHGHHRCKVRCFEYY